jgi:hypothetical protein
VSSVHRASSPSPVVLSSAEPDMGAQESATLSLPSSKDWDLMLFEAGLTSLGDGLLNEPMGSPVLDDPGIDSPSLEPVRFNDAPTLEDIFQTAPTPALLLSAQESHYVNTSRQIAPTGMEPGFIPSSPSSITQLVRCLLLQSPHHRSVTAVEATRFQQSSHAVVHILLRRQPAVRPR